MASTASAPPTTTSPEATVVALPPTTASASAPQPQPRPEEQQQQQQSQPAPDAAGAEEDLLRDVLDELDKERSKRAQVEADLRMLGEEREALQRQLEEERRKNQNAKPKEEDIVSRHAFVAMEAQVKGFKQLVDALTIGKPAIAAAAKATSTQNSRIRQRPSTLPLHVVRLLEVLPWDPRTHEHIFGLEVIYEWQIFDVREQKWHSNIRHFPNRLKNLPIMKPKPEDQDDATEDRSLLNFLAGGGEKAASLQSPSKHGVLTDLKLLQILKIEVGYPLPQDGGRWEWVGGWRVDKRVKEVNHVAAADKRTVDCDDDGWSYGKELQDFELLPTELIWDNPGEGYERRIRRRKWSRQRVLVDYPFASERTKQYLKLLAENARLTITSTKISDQLVETKTRLTEMEEAMMQLKAEKTVEVAKLTEELKHQEEGKTVSTPPGNAPGKRISEFLQKKDQVKEIGSKISQWVVRKTSEDHTTGSLEDLTSDAAAGSKVSITVNNNNKNNTMSSSASLDGSESGSTSGSGSTPFNWRKVGRGGLIEKLAGKKYNRSGSIKNDEDGQLLEEEEKKLKEEAG